MKADMVEIKQVLSSNMSTLAGQVNFQSTHIGQQRGTHRVALFHPQPLDLSRPLLDAVDLQNLSVGLLTSGLGPKGILASEHMSYT